jgi:hypothetical protein
MPAIKRILYTNFSNPDEIDLVRWTKHKEDIYKLISEATALTSSIPGVTTDNALARWDGTDGTALNDSGWLLDDQNYMTVPAGTKFGYNTTGSYLTILENRFAFTTGDGTSFDLNGTGGANSELSTPEGITLDADKGTDHDINRANNPTGIGSYWRLSSRYYGASDWTFMKVVGNEAVDGTTTSGAFWYDKNGVETAHVHANDGTASFTNIVGFTHGEGNPSSTPTNLIEMYRDDTNGNCFLWNGIEWGLITLGALPT